MGTCVGSLQLPPGSCRPGCSSKRVSFGSIQTRPSSTLVCTESGRTWVAYMVDAPPTLGPTGFHTPSFGSGDTPSGTATSGGRGVVGTVGVASPGAGPCSGGAAMSTG